MIVLETTKTINRTFKLKPYGKFFVKWVNTEMSERTLAVRNTTFNHNNTMPLTEEQDKAFIKEMKKNRTDVFISEDDGLFYSRGASGICEVKHRKLDMYKNGNNGFKELIDSM